MVISQAAECVIRAMLYMSRFPLNQIVSKQDICRTQEITPAFLIKIMQPLIAKGFVTSYRGVKGGFSLGRPPEKINLWDIIAISEGQIYLNKCMIHEGYCERDKTCPVHPVWHKAKNELEKILSSVTLAKLRK